MADNRGRRVGLTRDSILTAAVELADSEGLAAVSMRRLAAHLDVEAMTLYHYVPSKAALHDGMVEHVITLVDVPFDALPWSEALHAYAMSLLSALGAHPGVISLLATRPALTPRTKVILEAALESLQNGGVPPTTGLAMVQTLTALAVGHARTDHEFPAAADTEALISVDHGAHPLLAEAITSRQQPEDFFGSLVDTVIVRAQVVPRNPR